MRSAFDERRRQSDLHQPFGERVDMFERAIATPLKQDLLEDAFDAQIRAAEQLQLWASQSKVELGRRMETIQWKGGLGFVAKGADFVDIDLDVEGQRVVRPSSSSVKCCQSFFERKQIEL